MGLPYFSSKEENGTHVLRGYAVDLTNAILEIINKEPGYALKPEFYAVKTYGNPIEGTKKWDGIVGELIDHVSLSTSSINLSIVYFIAHIKKH